MPQTAIRFITENEYQYLPVEPKLFCVKPNTQADYLPTICFRVLIVPRHVNPQPMVRVSSVHMAQLQSESLVAMKTSITIVYKCTCYCNYPEFSRIQFNFNALNSTIMTSQVNFGNRELLEPHVLFLLDYGPGLDYGLITVR